VGSKFGRTQNTAFVSGTGAGQPRGILTPTKAVDSGSGVARGSVGYLITGVAGDWPANTPGNALIDLMYRLKIGYHANGKFLMNRATLGATRKLTAAGDYHYVWEPSFQAGTPSTILGAPVVVMEDMPAIADNAYPIAFGDWTQAYQIVDRIGISVLRDPYSAKPFVLFYTRMRVGGDVVNYEAYKLLQFAD
jgi:HK97 family phage major capsid protein